MTTVGVSPGVAPGTVGRVMQLVRTYLDILVKGRCNSSGDGLSEQAVDPKLGMRWCDGKDGTMLIADSVSRPKGMHENPASDPEHKSDFEVNLGATTHRLDSKNRTLNLAEAQSSDDDGVKRWNDFLCSKNGGSHGYAGFVKSVAKLVGERNCTMARVEGKYAKAVANGQFLADADSVQHMSVKANLDGMLTQFRSLKLTVESFMKGVTGSQGKYGGVRLHPCNAWTSECGKQGWDTTGMRGPSARVVSVVSSALGVVEIACASGSDVVCLHERGPMCDGDETAADNGDDVVWCVGVARLSVSNQMEVCLPIAWIEVWREWGFGGMCMWVPLSHADSAHTDGDYSRGQMVDPVLDLQWGRCVGMAMATFVKFACSVSAHRSHWGSLGCACPCVLVAWTCEQLDSVSPDVQLAVSGDSFCYEVGPSACDAQCVDDGHVFTFAGGEVKGACSLAAEMLVVDGVIHWAMAEDRMGCDCVSMSAHVRLSLVGDSAPEEDLCMVALSVDNVFQWSDVQVTGRGVGGPNCRLPGVALAGGCGPVSGTDMVYFVHPCMVAYLCMCSSPTVPDSGSVLEKCMVVPVPCCPIPMGGPCGVSVVHVVCELDVPKMCALEQGTRTLPCVTKSAENRQDPGPKPKEGNDEIVRDDVYGTPMPCHMELIMRRSLTDKVYGMNCPMTVDRSVKAELSVVKGDLCVWVRCGLATCDEDGVCAGWATDMFRRWGVTRSSLLPLDTVGTREHKAKNMEVDPVKPHVKFPLAGQDGEHTDLVEGHSMLMSDPNWVAPVVSDMLSAPLLDEDYCFVSPKGSLTHEHACCMVVCARLCGCPATVNGALGCRLRSLVHADAGGIEMQRTDEEGWRWFELYWLSSHKCVSLTGKFHRHSQNADPEKPVHVDTENPTCYRAVHGSPLGRPLYNVLEGYHPMCFEAHNWDCLSPKKHALSRKTSLEVGRCFANMSAVLIDVCAPAEQPGVCHAMAPNLVCVMAKAWPMVKAGVCVLEYAVGGEALPVDGAVMSESVFDVACASDPNPNMLAFCQQWCGRGVSSCD